MTKYHLYNKMLDEAIDGLDESRNELKRLETITEFETLSDYDKYKHDLKDAEIKEAIFLDLIHALKEALEFREYENLF